VLAAELAALQFSHGGGRQGVGSVKTAVWMGVATDVRVLPHRVVAPATLKPVGAKSGMFFATAPVGAAPSAIPRITTTDIIARARKQVQNPHEPRRATTGALRPMGERADIQQMVAALWRELNKLTGTTAAPPDAPPVAALQHATKRLRATTGKLIAERKQQAMDAATQAEHLASAESKHEELLEAAHKLEDQIRAERQQAQDHQQKLRIALQENEQLRQELQSTRQALEHALQSASLVRCGIEEEGSDIHESSSSTSTGSTSTGSTSTKGLQLYTTCDSQDNPVQPTKLELSSDVRHSVAATSGDALLTETLRAAKDGERTRLRSVEQSLEHERAARKRAETMVGDAEEETEAVQRLRQVETEQWVVELERVEAAARDQIDRLAEEREEARETAMVLQDDLHHERKHNIALETVADAVALGAATEVERLRSAQIETLQAQLTAVQKKSTPAASSETKNEIGTPGSNGSQLSVGLPIPASLADHNWVNADYSGTEGLCCLGATSPTDSMPMLTPCQSLCSSNPPSRRHPAGYIYSNRMLSADSELEEAVAPVNRSPPKAKAKASGLRVAIPGETISEAAAVLGGCHGAGCEEEQEGLDVVSGLISGIAANIADQAVASVKKEKARYSTSGDHAAESTASSGEAPALSTARPVGGSPKQEEMKKVSRELKQQPLEQQPLKQQLTVDVDCAISSDIGVTVTPMGKLRQTCTPNSRYGRGGAVDAVHRAQ